MADPIRSYSYIGKIKNKVGRDLHVWLGRYTVVTGDTYVQATQCTLTFNGLSRILDDYDGTVHSYGVLALYTDVASLLSDFPSFTSVTNALGAAPILKFGVMQSVATGVPFPEKANAEAWGRTVNFYALVVGY